MRVGLIADTHGRLRPEALRALAGADLLLHAGDVGGAAVLESLAAVAPVLAVRGNNDRAGPCAALPERLERVLGGVAVTLLHDRAAALPWPAAGGVLVVGHSHRPSVGWEGGVLVVNPGSAGPRRFRLPVCVGWLELGAGPPQASWVELDAAG